MDDIYELNHGPRCRSFKDLSINEQLALVRAELEGTPIEMCSVQDLGKDGWQEKKYIPPHTGVEWNHLWYYRIAQFLPSIDWEHVHHSFNYLTVEESAHETNFNEARLYTHQPVWRSSEGGWWEMTQGESIPANWFESFDEGNCVGQKAFVCRPGVEIIPNGGLAGVDSVLHTDDGPLSPEFINRTWEDSRPAGTKSKED